MPNITRKGTTLLKKLLPSIEHEDWQWSHVAGICSLIARHATTHHSLMLAVCNGPWFKRDRFFTNATPAQRHAYVTEWEGWIAKRTKQIEDRITALVSELPKCNGESIDAMFSGDPRGCTVKLIMPDGRYDDWGHVGLCVPQDHR